jgi:hypothetical protein
MTSTEAVQDVSTITFTITPDLLRLIRDRPHGMKRMIRYTNDGRLMAFRDPHADTQAFFEAIPVSRNGDWDYAGQTWHEGGASRRASPDQMVGNMGWEDVPLTLGISEYPFFPEVLALRPEEAVIVMGDPRDGELRAYRTHDWPADGTTTLAGWQVFPRANGDRNYRAQTWTSASFSTMPKQAMLDSCWSVMWEKEEEEPVPLSPEVAALNLTISQLRAEIANLQRRLSSSFSEHERFKELVTSTASKYARRHDWCSVVDEALEEMGLEREPVSFSGVISVRINFTANRSDGERGTPNARDVTRWLYGEDDVREAIGENLSLDSDYADDFEIESYSFEVVSTS